MCALVSSRTSSGRAGSRRRASSHTVRWRSSSSTTNGLDKAERGYGPDANGWDDVAHLELAALSWVHWFNAERQRGYCQGVPPAEFEVAFYPAP